MTEVRVGDLGLLEIVVREDLTSVHFGAIQLFIVGVMVMWLGVGGVGRVEVKLLIMMKF